MTDHHNHPTPTPDLQHLRRLCAQRRWEDAEDAAQGDPRLMAFVAMCHEAALAFGTDLLALSLDQGSEPPAPPQAGDTTP